MLSIAADAGWRWKTSGKVAAKISFRRLVGGN
jgi:hypothetical protein